LAGMDALLKDDDEKLHPRRKIALFRRRLFGIRADRDLELILK